MYQVDSSWTISGTGNEIETKLEHDFAYDFVFKGPGLYLTDTDTLLIISRNRSSDVWHQVWEKDEQFCVYIYGMWI